MTRPCNRLWAAVHAWLDAERPHAQVQPRQYTLAVEEGSVLSLPSCSPAVVEIELVGGAVWVTRCNDRKDHVLHTPGDRFRSNARRMIVLQGLVCSKVLVREMGSIV